MFKMFYLLGSYISKNDSRNTLHSEEMNMTSSTNLISGNSKIQLGKMEQNPV